MATSLAKEKWFATERNDFSHLSSNIRIPVNSLWPKKYGLLTLGQEKVPAKVNEQYCLHWPNKNGLLNFGPRKSACKIIRAVLSARPDKYVPAQEISGVICEILMKSVCNQES